MMERETNWEEIQKTMQSDQGLIELIRFRKYDFKVFVENTTDRVRFGFTDSVFYAALITTKATLIHLNWCFLKMEITWRPGSSTITEMHLRMTSKIKTPIVLLETIRTIHGK